MGNYSNHYFFEDYVVCFMHNLSNTYQEKLYDSYVPSHVCVILNNTYMKRYITLI